MTFRGCRVFLLWLVWEEDEMLDEECVIPIYVKIRNYQLK